MQVRSSAKAIWPLIKQTVSEFLEDKCPRLGAALAYYTIFSVAPLLIIATGVAGIFFGSYAGGSERMQAAVNQFASPQAAQALDSVFKQQTPHGGLVATVIGIVVLLFGAAGVFTELQDSLNTIWGVTPKPGRGILGILRDRFLSFSMVGGVLFLLLTSLVVTTMLEGAGHWLTAHTGPVMRYVALALNLIVSYGVITVMFAMIYKVLPDVKIQWRDVWVGAAVTAGLFVIGKFGLGLYLGRASVGSVYGLAGSLLVLLTWIYYSAQIFLVGAEFVQVWVKERGGRFVPDENAIPLTRAAREAQGIPKESELQAAAVRSGKTVADDVMPSRLADSETGARTAAKQQRRAANQSSTASHLLPALAGAALGFWRGRTGRKRTAVLVLTSASRPKTLENKQWANIWHRFRGGWQSGVKK